MNQTLTQSDIVNLILQTINTIFSNVFSSIDNNIYSSLDKLVFVNNDIINTAFFKKLLGANGISGILYLTNAMLLGISIFYIIRLFYSNYVEISIEKPFQFIFKILIFGLLVNFSYFLCEQILNINYLISSSLQEIGKDIVGNDISFSELISRLNSKITISQNNSFDFFSFDGLLKSITSIGLLSLLFSYAIRYIMIQFFALTMPIALLTLINSSTSWIFKSWFKCFFSLLVLQVFIPIILIVIFSIDSSNDILFIGSIYALTKINSYIRDIFGGINVEFSNNFSNMLSMFKK